MKVLEYIKQSLLNLDFEISEHAYFRALSREISLLDIQEITENIEIIEDYPNDKYSPSALLLGWNKLFRPMHIQVTSNTSKQIKIITIYEPTLEK